MVAEENVNEMHHNSHSEENHNKAQPSTTENHNKAQSSTETHQHTPPSGCVCKADILVCATTSQSPESKLVASPAHLKIDSPPIIKIHSQMQRYLAQHRKITKHKSDIEKTTKPDKHKKHVNSNNSGAEGVRRRCGEGAGGGALPTKNTHTHTHTTCDKSTKTSCT